MYRVKVLTVTGMYYDGEPKYFSTEEGAVGFRNWIWSKKRQQCATIELVKDPELINKVEVLNFCVQDKITGKRKIFPSLKCAEKELKIPYSLLSNRNDRYFCSFTTENEPLKQRFMEVVD